MEHHKTPFAPVHIILATLIGIVLVFNTYQTFNITKTATPTLPDIKVTLITADCADCTDLTETYNTILAGTTYHVNDRAQLDISDPHAQKLTQDNNLTRLPVIIIEGSTQNIAVQGARKLDDVLIIDASAPYYDLTSASVKGRVGITYVLADSCPNCINITLLGSQLRQINVAVASERQFTASSDDGKRLVTAYALKTLPAVILSPDITAYDTITSALAEQGDFAPDGSFVLRTINPPYFDLSTNTVRGFVDLTNLVDASCPTCYNVSMHKPILAGLGIVLRNEKTVDVTSSEGKQLVAQHNIDMVPTIILTGDPQLYPALQQVWPQVGTADNNVYVFRNTALLTGATSKNLTSGTTIVGAQ